jgi:hypothetical protein
LRGFQFEANLVKKQDPINRLHMVVHTCHPSYVGSINRIVVQASPRQKCKALFEKSLKQKGLEAWLRW